MGWLSWLRREKPLHQRLAEEGGLVAAARDLHDTRPRWGEVGIHGVHRPRRWDVVVSTEAPDVPGDRHSFTVLPDGSLLLDDDLPDAAADALAEALEATLAPPYRAEAVRQEDDVWAVAAKEIEVVELGDDVAGDEIELVARGEERTLRVDGMPAFGSVPALERLGAARFDDYVVRATRLDGDFWAVSVAPL